MLKSDLPVGLQFSLWAGAIMAVCGFFALYIFPVTWLMQSLHIFEVYGSLLGYQDLSATAVAGMVDSIYNVAYLVMIVPILGSGFVIWINSLIVAYRRRTLGSIAVAGWNSFAQISNTVNAVKFVPSAFKGLGKAFSGKKGGQALAYLLIILLPIVLSLGAAIATTAAIMHAADERFQLDETARKQLAS